MGYQGYRWSLLSCGAVLAIIASANAAGAQGTPEIELAPVVVEGAADTSEPTQDKTQTKISRTVLQERMADDFQDVGRRVDAGVNFDETNKSINLRGLQDDRVLTTIDGVRVPWLVDPRDSAKGGMNAFDFDSLSALDIVRGADSSRYGSGALGGVVQLRTLNPEDLIEEGKSLGGLVKGSYDSADQNWRSNAAVAARANDTWMMVQGGYGQGHETENFGEIGGYGAARTEPNPRDYDRTNVLAKLHHYVEGGHRLGLTAEIANRQDDFEDMDSTTASYVPGSFMAGEEIDRKRVSAEYTFESPDKSHVVDTANLIAYWVDQKLTSTTDAVRVRDPRSFIIPRDPFYYGWPAGDYTRENWIRQTSYGLTGDASKDMELAGLSHTLRFGGEIYGQKTSQYSSGEDNCPDVDWRFVPAPFGPQACRFLHTNAADMPEVQSSFVGFFVEDDIKFLDDRLTVTPGVRFDWYDHSPKSTAEFERSLNYDPAYLEGNSDAGISPKLRLAWAATPEVTLFAQWAQGFRAPSAKELYQNFANAGQYARLGNPNLNAETSNGFEIGAAYEGEGFGVSANLFNNYYRNFIDEVTLPSTPEYTQVFSFQNLDRVQIYGAELRGHVRFASDWKAWGSLAYSVGKNRDNGDHLNSIPPLRAILGLGYEQETWGADVSTTLASRRDKVSGTGSEAGFVAPGYGVVDVSAWWKPEQIKGLRVQAGVYNLFDKKYWNAIDVPEGRPAAEADRYTEAGRSFRIAISQKF